MAKTSPEPVDPVKPVADLAALQREIRTLHNRYLNEKSCTAYLDEGLTYLLNHEADFAKLASQKAMVEREIAALKEMLTTLHGTYDERQRQAAEEHQKQLAIYRVELAESAKTLEHAKKSSEVYCASLKKTEQDHAEQLKRTQALVDSAHTDKTRLTAQASELRTKIEDLRKEFARV